MSEESENLPARLVVGDLAGVGQIGRQVLEAIRAAIGTLYRPRSVLLEGKAQADAEAYAIVRRAEAERQARLIEADGEADLEQRALARLRSRELTKQANLELIIDDAVAEAAEQERLLLPEQEPQEARPIDPDWIGAFIDLAQDVSAERIRAIWAKILASQANARRPAVSRATLDALRLLEPDMATAFRNAMRLWIATGQIMDLSDENGPDGAINLNAMEMLALTEIGFLRPLADREDSLEFNGAIFSFHRWERDEPFEPGEPSHVGALARQAIRIDRMLPTWRGMELATILFDGFYDITGGKVAISEDAFGAYADATTRAIILQEWAEKFDSRGYVVIYNELKHHVEKTEQETRSSANLVPCMIFDGTAGEWRDLPTG